MKSRRNFSQCTHPINPIGLKTHVSGCFGLFHYCTKFDTKWAKLVRLMHKLGPWNRFRIFCNERTRSTLFEPKLKFWGFSDRSLLHELSCKKGQTGAINAQVRATKWRWNFPQWTHPIHPIGLKLMFWGISDHSVIAPTSVQNGPNWCD
jgi:hypothetical protein